MYVLHCVWQKIIVGIIKYFEKLANLYYSNVCTNNSLHRYSEVRLLLIMIVQSFSKIQIGCGFLELLFLPIFWSKY